MTIKEKKALTSDQVVNTLEIFKISLDKALNSSYNQEEVLYWINNTVLMHDPLVMFRSDSLTSIRDSIFDSETIRRFICDLNFRFFTTCNESNENFLDSLVVSLANGLTIDGPDSIIPDQISESYTYRIFLKIYKSTSLFKRRLLLTDFLKSNKHIILVLLIILLSSIKSETPNT